MKLSKKDLKAIDIFIDKVEDEGVEYALIQYGAGEDIKDDQFQEARKQFIDSYNVLKQHIIRLSELVRK